AAPRRLRALPRVGASALIAAAMALVLDGVHKSYGGRPALHDLSLTLPSAGYTCVMGPSGSGKTTLLRIVGGFEVQDGGGVTLDGDRLDGRPPERRPLHTLFQDYALFPHLSVADNVGFAPRILGVRGAALRSRVSQALADVGLDPALAERKPIGLSGGEQQRVALARALAGEARWLLLDEPLAALDRPLRAALRRLLRGVQRERGLGCVHVTHDPEEAMALADTLVILGEGRLLAHGPPQALYDRPPSLRVGRLLGELTRIPGGRGWIRPERLRIVDGGAAARVRSAACLGDRWELELEVEGSAVIVRCAAPPAAESVGIEWDPADALDLDEE
ncbi:MAG: ABC transporter ATP-binding protein, partial [Nannocystaceae bacterium]